METKGLTTRLIDLTIGEAFEILKPQLSIIIENAVSNLHAQEGDEYEYGIKAIEHLLNCSPSKANKIKRSGILDDAITQDGRSIVVNMTIARRILKERSIFR